jgi:hypothetical protein
LIELREQLDGRWLIVLVRAAGETQRGWISPSGILEAIVGMVPAKAELLLDVLEFAIRVCGVKCVRVPKGGAK